MAQHGGVAVGLGQFDRIESLGERADLIHLNQDRIGGAGIDSFLEKLCVRDEQIVADYKIERPLAVQLFGSRPEALAEAARKAGLKF
jgi:hypothetical protein